MPVPRSTWQRTDGLTLARIVLPSRSGGDETRQRLGRRRRVPADPLAFRRGAAVDPLSARAARLARASLQAGDRAGTLAAYHDFTEGWKDADPDLKDLQPARAELAKLKRVFESSGERISDAKIAKSAEVAVRRPELANPVLETERGNPRVMDRRPDGFRRHQQRTKRFPRSRLL
jgi:hypothetical protein